MIEINLLPEQYRKKKSKLPDLLRKYKSYILPAIGFAVIFIVVCCLLIIVYPMVQKGILIRLEGNWVKVEPQFKEVVALNDKIKELQRKRQNIDSLILNRLSWARKLNEISDAMPSEIQLTEMKLIEERGQDGMKIQVLNIAGLVPAFPGERAIEEFIKSLKENSNFADDFPRIEPPYTETNAEGFKTFILKCCLNEKWVLKEPEIKPKEDKDKDKEAGKKKGGKKGGIKGKAAERDKEI